MNNLYMGLILVAVTGTVLTTSYFKGRSDGAHAEKLRQIEAVQELNDRLRDRERELAELEAIRIEEARQLQNRIDNLMEEAREDPNADRPSIGVGSVLRLNSVGRN
jgi:uncharacterized protein YlxW (UPF0749 family)